MSKCNFKSLSNFGKCIVLIFTLIAVKSLSYASDLVGYWRNWVSAESPYIQLNQIDSRYSIIEVAFAIPVSTIDMTMTFTPEQVTQATFTSQVQALKNQGKKILISIGGQNAVIGLNTTQKKNAFVTSMTNIINTYGFNGLDIDIENGNSILISGGTIANPTNVSMQNLIQAIREIMQNYRTTNNNEKLMLTMAPETAYVQGGQSGFGSIWGGYLPIIHALKDSIDILQVQLYNSGTMYGINGSIYSQGTADFISAMTEAVIQGFNTSGGWFTGLPAEKVAVGLPACTSAAGGGYTDTSVVRSAIRYLRGLGANPGTYTLQNASGYPNLRGMMTWSINWDAVSTCNGAYSYAACYERTFPATAFSLSGTVKYANTAQTVMNNCIVIVKNASNLEVARDTTDVSGAYSVAGIANGTYTIEVLTTKLPGGINTSDILSMRQRIGGTITYTTLQNKAGDINNNGSIATTDLLPLRLKISNAATNTAWLVPNYVFDPLTVTINGANATLNIQALCGGDVNGSFVPGN